MCDRKETSLNITARYGFGVTPVACRAIAPAVSPPNFSKPFIIPAPAIPTIDPSSVFSRPAIACPPPPLPNADLIPLIALSATDPYIPSEGSE